ncbi:MAG: hypothetical protein ACJAVI_005064, partial [Candidatus Azotimanducaceae bacterium]
MLKERGSKTEDGRWFSSAADRNKEVILGLLSTILPDQGLIAEIASGPGQHIIYFAENHPKLRWQPTEPDDDLRGSIVKNIELSQSSNILPPIKLNVLEQQWQLPEVNLIFNANMIHVSPPEATSALIEGVSRHLKSGARYLQYGPFIHQGKFNSEGNQQFHQTLGETNPEWGLREIDNVIYLAESNGLKLEQKVDMPANNT